MANTPDYSWPPMDKRKVIGTAPQAPGRSAESLRPREVHFRHAAEGHAVRRVLLTCPHAHASVTVHRHQRGGEEPRRDRRRTSWRRPATEMQWARLRDRGRRGHHRRACARRGAQDQGRVRSAAAPRQRSRPDEGRRARQAAGEQVTGDPDKAFQEAEVVSEGSTASRCIHHCCLEPHGQVIEWKGDQVDYWPSTQNVAGIGGDLAPRRSKVPAANIHAHMDYIGGGVRQQVQPGCAGAEACARLSKKAGGKPVKLFLDRATELLIAGNRPSVFAKIKVGGEEGRHLSRSGIRRPGRTGGFGGGEPASASSRTSSATSRTCASTTRRSRSTPATQRAWRAPNNPAGSPI